MHQTNPTEMFREPPLAQLREAEDLRLARQPRAESEEEEERRMSNGDPEAVAVLERPEESWLQILWSTGPVP
jgi:hypothetical protein